MEYFIKYLWLIILWMVLGYCCIITTYIPGLPIERLPIFIFGIMVHIITGIVGLIESNRKDDEAQA